MKDRIPLYPGRVKMTPVAGQENTYDMVRADEPQQEGTPLNKSTLLSDEVAAAIAEMSGADAPVTPNEAFSSLREMIANGAKIATGSYTGTGTYGNANPNMLSFSFTPKLVIVAAANSATTPTALILVNGMTKTIGLNLASGNPSNYSNYEVHVKWIGNSVSWYNENSSYGMYYQFNLPERPSHGNIVYNYVAIG